MPTVVYHQTAPGWETTTLPSWAESYTGNNTYINYTATTSTSYPIIWNLNGLYAPIQQNQYIYRPPPESQMDLGELSRHALREDQQLYRDVVQANERARDRATETLLALLNPDERAAYERDGHLVVAGSAGGRYRIDPGYQQNVYELDEQGNRRAGGRLCAHPVMHQEGGTLPAQDAMIAQLLMLRYDEPGFLAIANRS